eukprot:2700534-Ditylum_brightwellii.AAC.1
MMHLPSAVDEMKGPSLVAFIQIALSGRVRTLPLLTYKCRFKKRLQVTQHISDERSRFGHGSVGLACLVPVCAQGLISVPVSFVMSVRVRTPRLQGMIKCCPAKWQ